MIMIYLRFSYDFMAIYGCRQKSRQIGCHVDHHRRFHRLGPFHGQASASPMKNP